MYTWKNSLNRVVVVCLSKDPTRSSLLSNRQSRNEFLDIKIDPTMAWDHLPDRYISELKTIADATNM